MNRQKEIRTLGLIVMITALMLMVYKYIKDTDGTTDYIVFGLVATVIGMFLASYGKEQEKNKNG